MKRYILIILMLFAPLVAHAQTGISVGYTGMHDGQRGRVVIVDYRPEHTVWDFSLGNISHTVDRDTSWAGLQYEIIDRDLYAGFGPALISHQTGTLTSQYQFMTTFGFHRGNFGISVRHISNGGTRGDNVGENLVTFTWTF